VDHREQVPVEPEDEAFAEARERRDRAAFDRRQRGIERAHEERACHARALDGVAQHARLQGRQVELDVREFGHASAKTYLTNRDVRGGPRGEALECV